MAQASTPIPCRSASSPVSATAANAVPRPVDLLSVFLNQYALAKPGHIDTEKLWLGGGHARAIYD
jgi:hypothetical protein